MKNMLKDLEPYTLKDNNGDSDGWYTISSIYFDNEQKQCYYETINSAEFRQKLRLRVYNKCTLDSTSFFEIKLKINGLVRKRRIKMKLSDAMDFIDDCINKREINYDEVKCSNKQILREIVNFIESKKLVPVNVVSYERLALYAKDDESLRITFDTNVRTRGDNLDLTAGTYGNLTSGEGIAILELKTSKNLPVWLVQILGRYGYRNQTFSKYCSHYLVNEGEIIKC